MKRDIRSSTKMPALAAAGKVSRRTLLKGAAAAGVAAATGPWYVRDAFSSSGEVRVMTWAGYDFKAIAAKFEQDTGIKAILTQMPDQDAMLAQIKASGGAGFDIVEPAVDRVPNWYEQGLLQPLDDSKVNVAGIDPAFVSGLAGESATIEGKRYGIPTIWGTEALCHNTQVAPLTYGTAGYADLWKPDYVGKVTVRPHSGLVGIGLMLQGEGKLPHDMREAFADPTKMKDNYDIIIKFAIDNRKSIGQFWSDENTAQGAFRTNGIVIGQNWDTSASALMKEGLPIGYLAPKEGALAWMQAFVMLKQAKNVDQANAWLAWFNSPWPSAGWAKAFGANPTAKGATKLMPESTSKFIAMAYPGDALKKLWWWPAQPSWFVSKRNEYADKFQSA